MSGVDAWKRKPKRIGSDAVFPQIKAAARKPLAEWCTSAIPSTAEAVMAGLRDWHQILAGASP